MALASLHRVAQFAAAHLWGISSSLRVARHSYNLLRLGSCYGGWTFVEDPALCGSVMISCGLGEDASFDIEFAARFGAQVLLVDPTPRAIKHFEEISSKYG